MEDFLLELGEGFTFIGRQRRLRIDQTWYRVDLLLFHRRLRCLVIIDLKLGSLTHADVGQVVGFRRVTRAVLEAASGSQSRARKRRTWPAASAAASLCPGDAMLAAAGGKAGMDPRELSFKHTMQRCAMHDGDSYSR